MKEPIVRETALEFGTKYVTAVFEGGQHAEDEFGALHVVQPEARRQEQVILEYIGGPLPPVVMQPFGKQDKVGIRVPYGTECIFAARDIGRVVFLFEIEVLIEPAVLRTGAVDGLQLEKQGTGGKLGVQAVLANLFIMRRQDEPGARPGAAL